MVPKGCSALESEGYPIQFRNLKLKTELINDKLSPTR
jgi:hypothetical protein